MAKMTEAQDAKRDKKAGVKEDSKKDKALDKKVGVGQSLSAADRKKLPSSSFGLPGKGSGPQGKGPGSYPMNDKKHAASAKGFASRFASPGDKAKIDAKANKILGKSKK